MNIFKLFQGVDNDLPEVMDDNSLYLTTDTKRTFIGGKELQKKQLENYSPSEEENEALLIKNGDTVEEAFGKLETSVINNEYVTAKAMTTLNDSCGFDENGVFTPNSDVEYTKNTSNVTEALMELDNAIVKNEKVVAKAMTTLNDSCGFDENGKYTPEEYSEYINGAKTVANALQKLDSALRDVADNAGGGLTPEQEELIDKIENKADFYEVTNIDELTEVYISLPNIETRYLLTNKPHIIKIGNYYLTLVEGWDNDAYYVGVGNDKYIILNAHEDGQHIHSEGSIYPLDWSSLAYVDLGEYATASGDSEWNLNEDASSIVEEWGLKTFDFNDTTLYYIGKDVETDELIYQSFDVDGYRLVAKFTNSTGTIKAEEVSSGGGGGLTRAEMESYISSLNYVSSATMNTELSNKVDKVSGKGLSTNDFTNTLKNKLDELSNYNDAEVRGMISSLNTALNTLIGTEGSVTEAIDTANEIFAFLNTYKNNDTLASVLQTLETNLHTWVENKGYLTSHQSLANYALKSEIPTVPTKVSAFENDANYLTEHQSLANYALNSTVTALEARVKALEDALAAATNFEAQEY